MNDKNIRYIFTIFTLDKTLQSVGITTWNKDGFTDLLKEQERKYGLKLIRQKEEISIIVEYTNITWIYKIYYGSYKKKYNVLNENDDRWIPIKKQIQTDLKVMGLDNLNDDILSHLMNNNYFEYTIKIKKQFKNYCV